MTDGTGAGRVDPYLHVPPPASGSLYGVLLALAVLAGITAASLALVAYGWRKAAARDLIRETEQYLTAL